MKEFVFLLQDLFEWTFQILPPLGNIPNFLFSLALFVGAVYWMKELARYKRETTEDPRFE